MNKIYVQHSQNLVANFVPIEYYTIFYFFLQISLDILKNVAIMILRKRKQALSAVEQGGRKDTPKV